MHQRVMDRERERKGGKSGGWCRLLHPPLRFPSSHFLPPRRISASSLNRAHTNIHRYICILAGSFSASGSMRTSISASVYLQPFLEGFARSVSVFDHHFPPLCSTISRQQFNYLPCSWFPRFPRSLDFSIPGYFFSNVFILRWFVIMMYRDHWVEELSIV